MHDVSGSLVSVRCDGEEKYEEEEGYVFIHRFLSRRRAVEGGGRNGDLVVESECRNE